jgi:murein DD-endopeptidase MepM/ murein hydrolase activator NlpD
MKSIITFFLFLSLIHAQNPPIEAVGDEFLLKNTNQPCLTNDQRQVVKQTVLNGIANLKSQNKLAFSASSRGNHPLFVWPVEASENVNYNNVWAITNYVDHNNASPNQLQDYNCGTKTYDTNGGYNHQGIDIVNWPFSWEMMDNNSVKIVAAADGQIIAKGDGEFDRNCEFNSNPWNAVYVQHSDGSLALYGHMKSGTLTTKSVGDMVTQGEFLGYIGSSGSSTIPHLHFEVYQNGDFTGLIDPYAGPCNTLNSDSWWAVQKPYHNSGVNAALTHSAAPLAFPACPVTTDSPNESNQFNLSDDIYFSAFIREQVANTTLNLKVIRPDNSILYNWDVQATTTAGVWYYYWFFPVDMEGEWIWEVTYEGEVVSHSFNVGTLGVEDETLASASIYPNPFNEKITIKTNVKIKKVIVVDVLGKTILRLEEDSIKGITELNLAEVSNGMYFVMLQDKQNQKKTIKLIKK